MFSFPSLGRDDVNKVFVFAKNADTNVLSVGHAAHWYAYMSGTVNTCDGYSITHAPTAATLQIPPALFAGLVANDDIPYGEYGAVQCYGPHSAAVISGANGATPFTDVFTQNTHTASAFKNLVCKPLAGFGNTTGAKATVGALGVIQLSSTVTTQGALNCGGFWPGGYCVPLANPESTIATNASGTVKVFVKCL